jgi:hypothetical protein
MRQTKQLLIHEEGAYSMGKNDEIADDKGNQILRQMRADTGSKKHLDQLKLRAQKALSKAVDARDEAAFAAALSALGINPESEAGRTHLQGFRQLPPKCY